MKNNDNNAVISAMFEGESLTKLEQGTTWDESVMSADRDGTRSDDYIPPGGLLSTNPTRPPSPAPSHRSGLAPANQYEADEDMARALAASTADLRQENGVVGANGEQVFGPATKEYYDSSQWAMVPMNGGTYGAREIVPDLPVEQRVLKTGEPRVLKHTPNGDYLPNFLTICATIEGAREHMLLKDHVQLDYGQDAEWWKGHAISRPNIVHIEDGSPAEPESDQHDELLAETQRLMAFLKASHRSYGSVGALLETDILKRTSVGTTRSQTVLELFIESWASAASQKCGSSSNFARLFNSLIGTYDSEGMDTPDLSLVDLQVNIPDDQIKDLFALLDHLLWEADDPANMAENYIEQPAEVIAMLAHQENPTLEKQLRVEVPAEIYLDKYLRENVEATRETRTMMAESRQRIRKIEDIETKLKKWKHPKKNGDINAGLLLKHTIGHFNGQNRINANKLDRTYSASEDDEKHSPPAHYEDISQQLEKLALSIEQKLRVLEEEKEKTRKAIADLSKSPCPGLARDQLRHRYTLRGIATHPHITYLLYPATDDERPAEDDTTPEGYRWWRLEYKVGSDGGVQLSKSMMPDYDVLRAATLEHSSALLVYASDAITAFPSAPQTLPQPLQDFVDRDNGLLTAELQAEPSQLPPSYDTTVDMTDVPRNSIERASMDSTRADRGMSEHGDEDSPRFGEESFFRNDSFGLGPHIKQGYGSMDDDPPPVEIRLDDNDAMVESEMIERSDGTGGFLSSVDMKDREAGW